MDTARVRLLYSSLRGSLKLAQALLEIVQEMGLSVASVSKTNWIVFSFGTAILSFMGGLGVFFWGVCWGRMVNDRRGHSFMFLSFCRRTYCLAQTPTLSHMISKNEHISPERPSGRLARSHLASIAEFNFISQFVFQAD